MYSKVYFVNENYEILAEHLGKDCLGKEYDGNIPVENADGGVLTDLFKFYQKQIESKTLFTKWTS